MNVVAVFYQVVGKVEIGVAVDCTGGWSLGGEWTEVVVVVAVANCKDRGCSDEGLRRDRR